MDKTKPFPPGAASPSPHRPSFDGWVASVPGVKLETVQESLNRGQPAGNRREVQTVLQRLQWHDGYLYPDGKLLLRCTETGDETRARWQQATTERSFHGAIFGSRENHRNVTAYDVSIGSGIATSDRTFFEYVCAVADWRVQRNPVFKRTNVLQWSDFLKVHGRYLAAEPPERRRIIEASATYYSKGVLPDWLPLLPEGLPAAIECESMGGRPKERK